MEPLILRDLYVFRSLARLFNPFAQKRLGCNAELIVDEFAEKLLEELDYKQEARNIQVGDTAHAVHAGLLCADSLWLTVACSSLPAHPGRCAVDFQHVVSFTPARIYHI